MDPFAVTALPEAVADELAGFLRSHLAAPRDAFHSTQLATFAAATTAHRDALQDAQSQLATVIEPAAEAVLPLAHELRSTFEQVDRLEHLLTKVVAPQIKDLAAKLDATEQQLRRQERALNDGRPVDLWRGIDLSARSVFSTADYLDADGKLKDLSSSGQG
ncbi:hypothetical protein DRE_02345 [Drechslerella stenobrocha 248]|uniref:Uncharacterized protein n=1 Tax=Drechslerella stenobrocha 248 TaxID=1043628 RepID=W7HVM6_9PEZI|nr:hypothetical protein DRE_02345 [Drechslerella stenobrocha 248]